MSTEKSIGEFLASLEREKLGHEKEILEHQRAIAELEMLIPGIRSRLGRDGRSHQSLDVEERVYANLSLHKAILLYLAHSNASMRTAEIAAELQRGGYKSEAEDFRSAVSATLSVMASKYQEVVGTPMGWQLTEKGMVEGMKIALPS